MAFQLIGLFSNAFKMVWKNKRLWLLHFIINAVIVMGAVLWLKIPDASAWQLAAVVVAALLLVIAALWLHGGTLAYFASAHGAGEISLSAAFKTGRRHLLAFAVWAAIFACVVYAAFQIPDTEAFDSWLRSMMPAFLRRSISLHTVDWVINWLVNFVQYVLIPGLLLPFAVQFASHGFSALGSNFKAWIQTIAKISYWIWFCVLALLGIYVPNLIANWAPNLSSLALENLSIAVRFALAFGLTVTAWLVLASMLGRLGSGKGSESASGDATI